MFPPKTDWVPIAEFPDITDAEEIAIDVETRDPSLKERGPGWPTCNGEVVGYAIAVAGWSTYTPDNSADTSKPLSIAQQIAAELRKNL